MTIEDLTLKQTCECCPEQYDVMFENKRIGYIRYRGGRLTCQPVFDNEIQYFFTIWREDDMQLNEMPSHRRVQWLHECKQSLIDFYKRLKEVSL